MNGLNKVTLIGHAGKDPELKYFENNIAKATLSLATTEYFKDKNGQRSEHTEWHNIVFWRTAAENAQKLIKKGSLIYVEGKLQTRVWNDRDGIKRNITEIIADNFILLNTKDGNSSQGKDNNPFGSHNIPY